MMDEAARDIAQYRLAKEFGAGVYAWPFDRSLRMLEVMDVIAQLRLEQSKKKPKPNAHTPPQRG